MEEQPQKKRRLLSGVEENMKNIIDNSFDIDAYSFGISL